MAFETTQLQCFEAEVCGTNLKDSFGSICDCRRPAKSCHRVGALAKEMASVTLAFC